ncbi:unnamed protein product [Phytophthora lilii]|uniref:Unnamed protein product n=1 Tax=Phytophthora lilii TaxID=2077276 RepID=A0A9W6XBI5_9STRA|nr:unnamed protein product [Phytophthora lilii]
MWSRLTEGLADIVAPEEGDEQPRDDDEQLWSRFAAVVAPPPASGSGPPAGAEEDEQEQYICELERALLQRKKQNEALESKTDALATQCQAREKELITLRDRVDELQAANETLQDDEREARSRAAEYEQGYLELLAEIEKIKTAHEEEKAALVAKSEEHASSIDSQRLYDLEARLTTSEADKALAQQDAERLQHDLNALEGVLHQFQVDSKVQKERVAAIEAELEQAKKELQARQPLSEPREGENTDLERVMETLVKKTHECEQLREVRCAAAVAFF